MFSPDIVYGMPFIYVNSILLLKIYMNNKNPYELKLALNIYNIIQILLNLYMIYGLKNIITFNNIFGLNIIYTNNIDYYVKIHYLSKYFDFLDTFFIILRKKNNQLSFLHIYHHMSVPIIWGFMIIEGHGNGTASFGCLINSLIHMIMYSHYLYTSLGFNNPFKKFITQAQLCQFFLFVIHSILVLIYENIVPRKYAYIQFLYQIPMITLFGNFYRKYNLRIK